MSFLLQGAGVKATFEDRTLPFLQPAQKRRYNPDFRVEKDILFPGSPEVFIEVKGQLTSADRKKLKLIKEQYPEMQLILLFGRAENKLNKQRPTTYADWCDQYGIPWLDVRDVQDKGDIKACLSRIMKTQRSGKLLNLRKRKSTALLQLARG